MWGSTQGCVPPVLFSRSVENCCQHVYGHIGIVDADLLPNMAFATQHAHCFYRISLTQGSFAPLERSRDVVRALSHSVRMSFSDGWLMGPPVAQQRAHMKDCASQPTLQLQGLPPLMASSGMILSPHVLIQCIRVKSGAGRDRFWDTLLPKYPQWPAWEC